MADPGATARADTEAAAGTAKRTSRTAGKPSAAAAAPRVAERPRTAGTPPAAEAASTTGPPGAAATASAGGVSSDALSAFAVFAEHLNFTRAAAELHISQPALHVKVAKLARALDRPLYHRSGRRLGLIPAHTTGATGTPTRPASAGSAAARRPGR
ncbi:helix-turn-helix domain-containing protein [Phytohabitans kaempferiae]|uniref:LysR family transcriptional regulator n=1 Tax=Phytohabitans kaempferiae TaxID=1620943 RepID=A0ABV6MBP1_9ACTN